MTLVIALPNLKTNDEIVFTINNEEVSDSYTADVEFRIDVAKVAFNKKLSVSVCRNSQIEVEDHVVWSESDHSFYAILRLKRAGEYQISLLRDKQILKTSSVFNINLRSLDLSVSIQQKLVSDFIFVSKEKFQVEFFVDQEMDIEKSAIYLNFVRQQLDWQMVEGGFKAKLDIDIENVYWLGYKLYDIMGNSKQEQYMKKLIYDKTTPAITKLLWNDQITIAPYSKNMKLEMEIKDNTIDLQESYVMDNGVKLHLNYKQVKDRTSFTQNFSEGMHEVEYYFVDASKQSIIKKFESFIVDQTSPALQLDFDKRAFLNVNQNIKMKVKDLNFDEDTSYLLIQHDKEESKVKPVWKKIDDTYESSVCLSEEGAYKVRVVAIDYAGNEKKSDIHTFTIDKKGPEIVCKWKQMTLDATKLYYANDSINLNLQVNDKNLKIQKYRVFKNKKMIEEKEDSLLFSLNKEKGRNNDFIVQVEASDLANNVTKQNFRFSILTNIPPVEIANDVFLGKAFNGNWVPSIKHESEQYRVIDVKLVRDLTEVNYRWKDAICEEGEYDLGVIVSDLANNIAQLAQPFHFTIDKTPPILQLRVNDSIYKKQTLMLKDQISIDVQKTDERRQKGDKVMKLKIDQKLWPLQSFVLKDEKRHDIEAWAIDEAGNIVKKNWIIQAKKATQNPVDNRDNLSKHSGVIIVLSVILFMIVVRIYASKSKN